MEGTSHSGSRSGAVCQWFARSSASRHFQSFAGQLVVPMVSQHRSLPAVVNGSNRSHCHCVHLNGEFPASVLLSFKRRLCRVAILIQRRIGGRRLGRTTAVPWLSWLERSVHIRKVTGSSPVGTIGFVIQQAVFTNVFIGFPVFSRLRRDFYRTRKGFRFFSISWRFGRRRDRIAGQNWDRFNRVPVVEWSASTVVLFRHVFRVTNPLRFRRGTVLFADVTRC